MRKISHRNALCFVVAQLIGGTLGVLISLALLGDAFTAAPVNWTSFWIYIVAPILGMQVAAGMHFRASKRECAKLIHATNQPCIHCGYQPPKRELP